MGARGAHSTEVCVDPIGKRMSQSWENQRAVNREREARSKRELGTATAMQVWAPFSPRPSLSYSNIPGHYPYPYLQRRKLKALRSQESCPGPSTKKQKGNNGPECAQRPSEAAKDGQEKWQTGRHRSYHFHVTTLRGCPTCSPAHRKTYMYSKH